MRSPNTGLTRPRRAVHYPALYSRTDYFFSGRSWDYINIRSPHNAQFLSTYRSVRLHNSFTCMGNRIDYFSSGSSMEPQRFLSDLFAFTIRSPAWETISIIFRAGARWNRTDFCSICSPSQFVHLHGKPHRLFFERELDGTAPISVRVTATVGITHGRKTVSPSRNPCDSDPFLVATHNRCSPSWDPHRLLFFGPEPERNRINWDRYPVPFFSSTAAHRLAADRSNQIFLYATSRMKRHRRCRASAHLSNFGRPSHSIYERACWLEVFTSVFFYGCLVLHGLY